MKEIIITTTSEYIFWVDDEVAKKFHQQVKEDGDVDTGYITDYNQYPIHNHYESDNNGMWPHGSFPRRGTRSPRT